MFEMIKNKYIKGILEGAIEIIVGGFISNYYAIIASIGYGKLTSTYDIIQKFISQGDESCAITVQMFEVAGITIIMYGMITIMRQIYNYIIKNLVKNDNNEVDIRNYRNLNK